MRRVGVVVNPRAGGGRWLGRAIRDLAGLGPVVVTERPEDLPGALVGLRAVGVDLLAVLGGDGTLHAVLGAAERVWDRPPPLFVFHTGTVGLVHRNLALGGVSDAIRDLRAITRGDRGVAVAEVPTVQVDGRTAFNLGIGLPHHLADRAAGRGRTALLALRLLASASVDGPFAAGLLDPWRGTIQVDDGPERPVSASIVYASALGRLGPLRGWSRVDQPGDAFRLLAVPEDPPSTLLAAVPWFALGRGPGAVAARRLRLVGEGPFRYVADGEPYVADGLEVRRGRPVRVARAA